MKQGPLILCASAALLIAAGFSSGVRVNAEAVESFHASIVRAGAELPMDYGVWTGQQVDIPPSATKLLRPNVLIAREYQTPEHGGLHGKLLVVQCADIRDMQGHYPPNCYPAHGWTRGSTVAGPPFGGLETIRYEFTQGTGEDVRRIFVYNLFVLPSGRSTTSMADVRRASSDYLVRPYGAAQVQVVLDGEVPEPEHAWILSQFRAIAEPILRPLTEGAPEHREGEPS